MKLDADHSVYFKYCVAGLATFVVAAEGLLLAVLMLEGAGGVVLAILVGVVVLWTSLCVAFCLVAALGVLRYRVWLDGTSLCVQKSFTVHRSDLAEATEVDVQDNARGVPYLIVRGGGRALLQVRMVTSEGRPLPQNNWTRSPKPSPPGRRRTRRRRERPWLASG